MALSEELTVLEEKVSYLEEQVSKLTLQDKYIKMQDRWDKSLTRVILVAINTYIFVGIILLILGVHNVLINAFIPAGAYVLSQQTIPYFKKLWIKHYLEEESKKKEIAETKEIPIG